MDGCIEVSQDFFDDDDIDNAAAYISSYGKLLSRIFKKIKKSWKLKLFSGAGGGDFDPRLLKQMNFADGDNNGEVFLNQFWLFNPPKGFGGFIH